MYQLFTGDYLLRVPRVTIPRIFSLYFNSVEKWSKDLRGSMFGLCKHKYFQSRSGSTTGHMHYVGPETDPEHSVWVFLRHLQGSGVDGQAMRGVITPATAWVSSADPTGTLTVKGKSQVEGSSGVHSLHLWLAVGSAHQALTAWESPQAKRCGFPPLWGKEQVYLTEHISFPLFLSSRKFNCWKHWSHNSKDISSSCCWTRRCFTLGAHLQSFLGTFLRRERTLLWGRPVLGRGGGGVYSGSTRSPSTQFHGALIRPWSSRGPRWPSPAHRLPVGPWPGTHMPCF